MKPINNMSVTIEPPVTSHRRKRHGISSKSDVMGTTTKPTPMSRMSHSTELDEYRASMRHFLSTVEQSGGFNASSVRDRDSSDAQVDSGSSSGSEREKSPEFQWMDLASLRRKHDSVSFENQPLGNGSGMAKSAARSSSSRHHHLHHHCIGKDGRHYQRECLSASPAGKSLLNKKHKAHAVQARSRLQAEGVAVPVIRETL